jgi:hypothetical protein
MSRGDGYSGGDLGAQLRAEQAAGKELTADDIFVAQERPDPLALMAAGAELQEQQTDSNGRD